MTTIAAIRQMSEGEVANLLRIETPTNVMRARQNVLYDLQQIGIRPYDFADVERYKKRKQAFYDRLTSLIKGMQVLVEETGDSADEKKRRQGALFRCVCAALIGAALAAVVSEGSLVASAIGIIVGMFVLFVLAALTDHLYINYAHGCWQTTELEFFVYHGGKVPSEILALVRTVKSVRPDLIYNVEHLKLDPFLTVQHPRYPEIKYRIAVWDETGFKIAA